jgi:hypothetical protein
MTPSTGHEPWDHWERMTVVAFESALGPELNERLEILSGMKVAPVPRIVPAIVTLLTGLLVLPVLAWVVYLRVRAWVIWYDKALE